MSDHELPESLQTATSHGHPDAPGNIVEFREDFAELFRSINDAIAAVIVLLARQPAQSTGGTWGEVLTSYNRQVNEGGDTYTPNYTTVKYWRIPETNFFVDNTHHVLRQDTLGEAPAWVHLVTIKTKSELEQLLVGLLNMHTSLEASEHLRVLREFQTECQVLYETIRLKRRWLQRLFVPTPALDNPVESWEPNFGEGQFWAVPGTDVFSGPSSLFVFKRDQRGDMHAARPGHDFSDEDLVQLTDALRAMRESL